VIPCLYLLPTEPLPDGLQLGNFTFVQGGGWHSKTGSG